MISIAKGFFYRVFSSLCLGIYRFWGRFFLLPKRFLFVGARFFDQEAVEDVVFGSSIPAQGAVVLGNMFSTPIGSFWCSFFTHRPTGPQAHRPTDTN